MRAKPFKADAAQDFLRDGARDILGLEVPG
jgi:hypothetical protein